MCDFCFHNNLLYRNCKSFELSTKIQTGAYEIKQWRENSSFTRILKHNSSSYTFGDIRVENKAAGTTVDKTYTYPLCFPSYTAIGNYHSGRTYSTGGFLWLGKQDATHGLQFWQNGETSNIRDTVRTVNPGDTLRFYIICDGYKYNNNRDCSLSWITFPGYGTINVTANVLFYYKTDQSLEQLPSSGYGTTDPEISGKATISCPMTAGSSWTVAQYYKTSTYTNFPSFSASHTVSGSYATLKDIDTGSTTTVNNPTSVFFGGGSKFSISNGTTSVAVTENSLYTNGASRSLYYRELEIKIGYW